MVADIGCGAPTSRSLGFTRMEDTIEELGSIISPPVAEEAEGGVLGASAR